MFAGHVRRAFERHAMNLIGITAGFQASVFEMLREQRGVVSFE